MSAPRFDAALAALTAERAREEPPRRWFYVSYDQLSEVHGPWSRLPPEQVGIVLVESLWKAQRRPVHKQKLALILANQRHFALEMARRGVAVEMRRSRERYAVPLARAAAEHGGLTMMRPAERELRADLAELVRSGAIEVVPHEGWLTTAAQFARACPRTPWRMVDFYRLVRRETGVLMDGQQPRGGKLSFDADNREPWPGNPAAPALPRFVPDAITLEVGELVEQRFAHHPGRLDLGALPATQADAERMVNWALDHCLEHFGAYEDAMSSRSRNLFHTRLSPLLNILRLSPQCVLDAALQRESQIPLNSLEGFVRQLLGWREFVYHVHERSDGFRRLPGGKPPVDARPDDGGWGRWTMETWELRRSELGPEPDGGARPNLLDSHTPVPPAYWGVSSGMACLDDVVESVWEEGITHHIPRLMVLANLAQLLDIEPRALTNWFWAAYVDAFDWVVEPNVLGMGSFAAGDLMTTKPYVAGSGYIQRMSDYCKGCAFHPKKSCPLTPMYWAYLARHEDALAGVGRSQRQLWAVRKRSPDKRARDRATFEYVRDQLVAGQSVTPQGLAGQLDAG